MVEWGPELHTSAWRSVFDKKGDLQNKCKAGMSERERGGGGTSVLSCAECVS